MICADCKQEITDEYMEYKDGHYKCKPCHIKNPLGQFQECQVYSRVCGYIQSTKQWNPGKQEEYKARVPFKPDYEKLKDGFS